MWVLCVVWLWLCGCAVQERRAALLPYVPAPDPVSLIEARLRLNTGKKDLVDRILSPLLNLLSGTSPAPTPFFFTFL